MNIKFEENEMHIPIDFAEIHQTSGHVDKYDGKYSVIPTVQGETLKTANKVMLKNLVIEGIPYSDVSNTSGGSTVYIGNKVNAE